MATPSKSNKNSAAATAARKKAKKRNVVDAIAHVKAAFNNTIITITDRFGDTLSWSTPGKMKFKGARKSTPFAAKIAAEDAGQIAKEYGVKKLEVYVEGPGPGREYAIRGLASCGFVIEALWDVTKVPHNGCRPPKERRI
jgi:small subunit ribosomal protein S11